MQKFMETVVEHKFGISKENFVIRRMILFSYFIAKQQSSFIELREKAISQTPPNEVYYVLLLRYIQKDCNVMEILPNPLKWIKKIPKQWEVGVINSCVLKDYH